MAIPYLDEVTSALQSNIIDVEGYKNFKTPFYKIEVALGEKGDFRELPIDISKLIQKIEITETIQNCMQNTAVIEVLEGSREPFSRDGEDNGSGFITDLQFTNDGGFSFVSPELVGLAEDLLSLQEDVAAAASVIGDILGGDSKVVVDEDPPIENKEPQGYVFSPRNRIKITWGYAEDLIKRQFVGTINVVRTEFPENSQPVTTIVIHSGTSEFTQYTPKEGIAFKNDLIPSAFLSAIGGKGEAKDLTIEQLLIKFQLEFGFEIIGNLSSFDSSGEFQAGYVKVWAAGKTLYQFFRELADQVKAYFTVLYNPLTDKPVIIFIPQEQFEASAIISDKKLMTYKGPGSILKSVSVEAIYDRRMGSTKVGFDDNGNKVIASSGNGKEKQQLFEGAKLTDTNSASGKTASTSGKLVSKVANGNITGNVGYEPNANDAGYMKDRATNDAVGCSPMAITFTALGFTRFKPGPCPFFGLGNRLSGYYTIMNLTHSIDSNGYVVSGTAKGTGDGNEGLIGGNVIKENETSASVDVQLYRALGNTLK